METLNFEEGFKTNEVFRQMKDILSEYRERIKFVNVKEFFKCNPEVFTQEQENRITSRWQYDMKKRSIERHGIFLPIYLFKNLTMQNGRHRSYIFRDLGIEYIPVFVIEEGEEKFRELEFYGKKFDWDKLYEKKFLERFEELNKKGPWYQSIDFGNGYFSKEGYGAENKWNLILKDNLPDLTDKRVIDIGCSNGFFSFKAVESEAAHVLGLDIDPDAIEKALFVREILTENSDINYSGRVDFSVCDMAIENLEKYGKFDIAFLFNSLYKLEKNKVINVMKKLADMVDCFAIQGRYHNDGIGSYPSHPSDIRNLLMNVGFREINIYNVKDTDGSIYHRPLVMGRRKNGS